MCWLSVTAQKDMQKQHIQTASLGPPEVSKSQEPRLHSAGCICLRVPPQGRTRDQAQARAAGGLVSLLPVGWTRQSLATWATHSLLVPAQAARGRRGSC